MTRASSASTKGRNRGVSKSQSQLGGKPDQKETKAFLRGKLNVVLSLVLVGVTIALYSPVLSHSFVVRDDQEYVTANPHIHDGLSWSTVKWAFTATEAANWHPLTWLSHALDYQLFGLNATGHHLDSILIHTLNAVVIFWVLAWITKRVAPSLLVAALFALHPLNVESVAWVAERKNVLSTLFLFLAIGAYAWYAQKPRWTRYLLMASLFAAGLMAKPMLVTVPFLFLLLDYWPLERTPWNEGQGSSASPVQVPDVPRTTVSRLLIEKVPLLVMSAASSWMTLKAQRTVVHTFEEFPLGTRVENAVVSYGLYLWKMAWPEHLAFYPYSIFPMPAWKWILSGLVLAGVTYFVLKFHRRRYLPAGWFWFLGTLVPVIGLVQVGETSMADRYAYVPLIGIFIMIAWGVAELAEARKIQTGRLMIPAICVLVALGWVAVAQMGYWESDYDLWAHTLAVAESPFAHNALGAVLMDPAAKMTTRDLESLGSAQTRMDEARRHFERALEMRASLTEKNPDASRWDVARTLNNLGNLDRMQNRLNEARNHDEGALAIYRQLAQQNPNAYNPYLAGILSNLGAIDRLQDRMEEARGQYEEALKIEGELVQQNPSKYLPNLAMILNDIGMLDADQGRLEEARSDFEEALKIDRQLAEESPGVYLPQLAMTLENYGTLDAVLTHLDESHQRFEEALKIDEQLAQQNPAIYLPDVAMTLSNLGRVERTQNQIEEARAHYEQAANLLRQLSESDGRYAAHLASVNASLEELKAKAAAR